MTTDRSPDGAPDGSPDAASHTVADKPRKPREHVVIAAADPVKLGSMLLTIVEPHVGHEVAYNRWYERDHFYSGCMIGPWQFAGKRFVATADLKALRDPDPSAITGESQRGSYVSVYWVLDGHHDDWNLWAVDQVRALHKAGRMFEDRDHVHTLLYRHHFDVGRDADPVPAELALDHPYKGMIATWIEAPESEPVETARTDLERRLREEYLPAVLAGSEAGLVVVWEPLPLQVDVPGVARSENLDRRLLLLWFLDAEPQECFDATAGELRRLVEDAGHGTVIASLPFIPTVPGTDKYTDQLWPSQLSTDQVPAGQVPSGEQRGNA